MVQYGMTSMQAIQAATMGSARAIAVDTTRGSLSEGKYADIIAVRGNPADDATLLTHVDFVMKGGQVIKRL